MISNNHNKILVWSVVALVILNISTITSIAYHVYVSKQNNQVVTSTNAKQLESETEQYSGRYFRDLFGFSADQMDKFREFNPIFRQQARAITIQLAERRKQMLDEMIRQHPDTIKLNKLSFDIGTLHGRLKVITYKYFLDMKQMSTPEQTKKLEQLFQTMFQTDAQIGFQGPGNGQHGKGGGMGRGRNFSK